MSRVFVTGGAGYVGAVLVPRLVAAGHDVTALDLFVFGDYLPPESSATPALKKIKGDIRDVALLERALPGHDAVIHCLLYTSPSPRDRQKSRMPSSA